MIYCPTKRRSATQHKTALTQQIIKALAPLYELKSHSMSKANISRFLALIHKAPNGRA